MEIANDTNALKKVISLFGANDTGRGGVCPGCGHHSITIDNKKGKVLAWCSAECGAQKTINDKVHELLGPEKQLTLSTWCAWKKLPEHWVRDFALAHEGLYEGKNGKRQRIFCFPYIGLPEVREYTDAEGTKRILHSRRQGGLKFRPYKHKKGFWGDYTGPMLYGFHLLPYYETHGIDLSTMVLVEGESDTITLAYNGIPTLGVPGAPNGWRDEFAKVPVLAAARRILFIEEPDAASAKLTEKIAASFAPSKVWRVKLPVKDASDLWTRNPNEFSAEWQKALSASVPVLSPTNDPIAAEQQKDYTLKPMDGPPKPLEWLWPGKIPKDKITLIAGEPGGGKSLFTVWLAAVVSTGGLFPNEEAIAPRNPGDVLMMFCEDDSDDTVKPRLIAAGANRKRVHELQISYVDPKTGTTEERHLALDTDIAALRRCLVEHPEISLVMIDPISNYTGKAKITDEQAIREVLGPLKTIAAEQGVTFILVAHLNKRSDVTALNRVLGAVAMTGVARSAWLFASDDEAPEDGCDHGLMLHGKLNVGRRAKQSLKYTIRTKRLAELPPDADEVPHIEWNGESDMTADDALDTTSGKKSDKTTKRSEAAAFLRMYLAGGPKYAEEVIAAAAERHIAEKTLRRACKDVKVRSDKERGKQDGRNLWSLANWKGNEGKLPSMSSDGDQPW